MKLLPICMLFAAAYICGSLGDRPQSGSPTPPVAATEQTPEPVAETANGAPSEPNAVYKWPLAVSGGVMNEKAKVFPPPEYPAAARAVRATGDVSVQIEVDKNGKVTYATAVSGHPLLRSAAKRAAERAEFEPLVLSGKPVRVSGVLIYTFKQ